MGSGLGFARKRSWRRWRFRWGRMCGFVRSAGRRRRSGEKRTVTSDRRPATRKKEKRDPSLPLGMTGGWVGVRAETKRVRTIGILMTMRSFDQQKALISG